MASGQITTFPDSEKTVPSLARMFVKGAGHSYTVSESVAAGLDAASSKGQYFNAEIRNA